MAKDKEKKGLGPREIQIILILVGLVLIAAAYFLGFTKLNTNRQIIVQENIALEQEVAELRQMQAKLGEIQEQIDEMNKDIGDKLALFPAELRTQDCVDFFDQIEKQIKKVIFTSEEFVMNQIYFQDGAVLEAEIAAGAAPEVAAADGTELGTGPEGIVGCRTGISVNYTAEYANLKKVIEFILQYPERASIADINIAKQEGIKELSCTMEVNLYSVEGRSDVQYEDLTFPQVPIHKNDIFKAK